MPNNQCLAVVLFGAAKVVLFGIDFNIIIVFQSKALSVSRY